MADHDLRAAFTNSGTLYAQTDANGAFVFRGLAKGRYNVAANSANGFAPLPRAQFESGTEDLELRVGHYVRVEGFVLDESGARVAGVKVSIWPLRARTGSSTGNLHALAKNTFTDEHGHFTFANWDPIYFFAARLDPQAELAKTHIPSLRRELDPQKEGEIQLQLVRGRTIAGRVTDRDGNPVPAIGVQSFGPRAIDGYPPVVPLTRSTKTDADGRYALGPYPPGVALTLKFEQDKKATTQWRSTTRKKIPTGAPDVNVQLERGETVEGTIQGVAAEALKGVRMRLVPVSGGKYRSITFKGDTRAFSFRWLRAGVYKVQWSLPRGASLRFDGSPTELRAPTSGVEITATPMFAVHGRLLGVQGKRYDVRFIAKAGESWGVKSGEDGAFSIRGLSAAAGALLSPSRARRSARCSKTCGPAARRFGSSSSEAGRSRGGWTT